jgi:sec-independent protein translocase protein TatA
MPRPRPAGNRWGPVPATADQLTFLIVFGDILQPTHILFILVVALLVLGPKRLPEVGRSLGKGLRDFRGAMSGIEEHASSVFSEPEASTTASSQIDSLVQTIEPAEETVLVNTASTPVASSVTVPVASRQASARPAPAHEPDPADYAD